MGAGLGSCMIQPLGRIISSIALYSALLLGYSELAPGTAGGKTAQEGCAWPEHVLSKTSRNVIGSYPQRMCNVVGVKSDR